MHAQLFTAWWICSLFFVLCVCVCGFWLVFVCVHIKTNLIIYSLIIQLSLISFLFLYSNLIWLFFQVSGTLANVWCVLLDFNRKTAGFKVSLCFWILVCVNFASCAVFISWVYIYLYATKSKKNNLHQTDREYILTIVKRARSCRICFGNVYKNNSKQAPTTIATKPNWKL